MNKLNVAVDFDDTTALTNQAVISWHNRRYKTDHEVGPDSYVLTRLWGVDRREAERRFAEFVDDMAHDRIDPLPGASQALQGISVFANVHLVTGREEYLEGRTRVWLNAITPGVFTDCHFLNHYSPERRMPKSAICAEQDIHAIVEDSVVQVADILQNASSTLVLLMDTIWNQGFHHPRIVRVRSWGQVERILHSI
jgi:uncharacterized HAD superfamily protein